MGKTVIAFKWRIFNEDSSASSLLRYEDYRLIETSCSYWILSSLFVEKSR